MQVPLYLAAVFWGLGINFRKVISRPGCGSEVPGFPSCLLLSFKSPLLPCVGVARWSFLMPIVVTDSSRQRSGPTSSESLTPTVRSWAWRSCEAK